MTHFPDQPHDGQQSFEEIGRRSGADLDLRPGQERVDLQGLRRQVGSWSTPIR